MQPRVVICSDGKRGHENQSRVLSRILGDQQPLLMLLRDSVKEGGSAEALLRLRLRFGGGRGAFTQAAAAKLVAQFLQPDNNDEFRSFAHDVGRGGAGQGALFVVSTGTPPATFNLLLARMLGARSIVSMRPSLLPLPLFDLAVLPQHDLPAVSIADARIVSTPLALGYHDVTRARHQASQLSKDHGLDPQGRYWGIALGGPSRSCPWVGDRILDDLAELHGLARGEGLKLLVTTSRRTPQHVSAWLAKHFGGSALVPYMLDASRDPYNPLPAFHELCERMFISMDSFSMLSEAVHAGQRPLALRVRFGMPPGKLGRALSAQAAGELISLCPSDSELAPCVAESAAMEPLRANEVYDTLRHEVRMTLDLPGSREEDGR